MTQRPSATDSARILAAFSYLVDFGFEPSISIGDTRARVDFDRTLPSLAVRVTVESIDGVRVEAAIAWPGQAAEGAPTPTVTLSEIIQIIGPLIWQDQSRIRQGSSSMPMEVAAAALTELAGDALHGGLGLLFDAVVWHRDRGSAREGRWWAAWPYDDPLMADEPRRSRSEVLRDLDFHERRYRWGQDHEEAWPAILAFIRAFPASDEAAWLIEDVALEDGPAFIDRIESLARSDRAVRDTIVSMELGGFAGSEIELLERLQEEFRADR